VGTKYLGSLIVGWWHLAIGYTG